jgi:hypothetical protein
LALVTGFTLTITIMAKHESPEMAREQIEMIVKNETSGLLSERHITSDLRIADSRVVVDETPF